jgi:hypothetical protein
MLLGVPFADGQEPRKSDAPQLRDEYRSYKILSGCGALYTLERALTSADSTSRDPPGVLLWPRGTAQYSRD